jgi:protein ImuB
VRRYLALFFPRWPIQLLRRMVPGTQNHPAALFERSNCGAILQVCSAEANTLGVHSGMSVADAKALAPQLLLHELNLPECLNALQELCLYLTRFTPLTSIESPGPHAAFPQTLLLDITGCEDAFGGEEKLLDMAVIAIRKLGYKVRAAIAPTLGAAWALAHYGPATSITQSEPESLEKALVPVPLAGLRLSNEVLADFRPLGLNRIGDILKQPRESLPSRFGKDLLERLDQAFGIIPETLVPLRPAPEFRVARCFEYPVRNSEMLFKILEQLIGRLASDLQGAQRGARHIECWLYHEISAPVCAEVALHRCSHSRKHLWQLLHARLEDLFRTPMGHKSKRRKRTLTTEKKGLSIEVDESVEAVAIHVTASESVAEQQLPLFDRAKDDTASGELNLLLDRLVTRLGPLAVCRVQMEDDPLPERAFRLLTLEEHSGTTAPEIKVVEALRPVRLLPRPLPADMDWPRSLSFDGQQHAIRDISGPERIESGWWRERDQRRDYYIVEVESSARYWLFEDLIEQRWFLHGSFD